MMGPNKTFALTVHGFGDQKRIDEIREALWKPRSDQPKDQPKGEKRHRQEGGKSAGSAQEKSSSSQSSDSSDSTSSGESCSDDEDEDTEEDEEPKKKKAKKSKKEKRKENTQNKKPRSESHLLAKRRQPPLGSQGRLLQSSTASRAWRTDSQGRSSKSCLNSN